MNTEQAAGLLAALEAEHGAGVLTDLLVAAFRKDATENEYDDDWTETDALREWMFELQESAETYF